MLITPAFTGLLSRSANCQEEITAEVFGEKKGEVDFPSF